MEKLFINKTTYSKDTYMEFLRFHSKTYSTSYMLYTIFWSFVILLSVYLAFASNYRIQGVVLTIALIAFMIYRIYRPKRNVEKELKSDKISDNNTNTFTFYNKYFATENKNGSFNFRYFMLYRVFETDKFYYLYISRENAFLISKDSFSYGTAEDFSNFIKKKCRLKYRLRKEKKVKENNTKENKKDSK